MSDKITGREPFKEISETERCMRLTIHQESSHNPQARGHGFREQERDRERGSNHGKAGDTKPQVREGLEDGASAKLRK